MPVNRLIRRPARAVRDAWISVHRRAAPAPRLPFVVALVVAVVGLVVAVEHRPKPDQAVAVVDEQPSGPPTYTDESAFVEEEAELDIVEYGFSAITDADGQRWILAAAVVHNPHDGELFPGALSIQERNAQGQSVTLDQMFVDSIPPRSTVAVAYAMRLDVREVEVEALTLEQPELATLYPEDASEVDVDWPVVSTEPLPRFEVIEVEPLASPDGYRVHFRSVAEEATEAQVSVLFRDADGELVGGLPAQSRLGDYGGSYRSLPAGESEQYVDVLAEWIPEGADLDQIEIGPG